MGWGVGEMTILWVNERKIKLPFFYSSSSDVALIFCRNEANMVTRPRVRSKKKICGERMVLKRKKKRKDASLLLLPAINKHHVFGFN